MQTFLFYTSKVLRPLLASPLFLCLCITTLSLLSLRGTSFWRRMIRVLGLVSCVLLAIFSLPLTANFAASLWELPRGRMAVLSKNAPYDAILVLGGSVISTASGSEHIELNDSAERIIAGLRLYKAGLAPLILVSGGSGDMNYQETREAPFMAKLLSDFGVPTEALILERESRNTYENATLSAPILQNKGANRIILVTSAWHMRRSAAIFKKAKYDFVIYSVDSLQQPFSFPRDLIPDAQALDNLTRLLREWIGFVSYRALNRL